MGVIVFGGCGVWGLWCVGVCGMGRQQYLGAAACGGLQSARVIECGGNGVRGLLTESVAACESFGVRVAIAALFH